MAGYQFLFIALFVAQAICLEEPSGEKVKEYRALVEDWSRTASRLIRSLESSPSERAAYVSQQLTEALGKARTRSKREAPATTDSTVEGLQDLFAKVNENVKSFVNNMTSSPLYQQMQKLGEGLGEKGKELFGKLGEQVKNLQQPEPAKP